MNKRGIKPIECDYLIISFKDRSYKMKVGLSEALLNDLTDMKGIEAKSEINDYIMDTISRLERNKILEHLLWQPQYEDTLPPDEEYHVKVIESRFHSRRK